MKKVLAIALLLCLTHTTGLCFATHSDAVPHHKPLDTSLPIASSAPFAVSNETATFAYDKHGQLSNVAQGSSPVPALTHDPAGRLADHSISINHSSLIINHYSYGPHGEDWGSTGHNPTPFTWLGGYGVTSLDALLANPHPDISTLRLYLTRHRLYSATLNRFLSPDPLGLEGGLNLYAYAEGNPLAYIDPLGLCAQSIAGAAWSGFWEGFGQGLEIGLNALTLV